MSTESSYITSAPLDRTEEADDSSGAGAVERVVADQEAINPADIRYAAMNLLARREHSLQELHKKLAKKFDDFELVEAELHKLAEENLQSDDRYAQSYVRQRSGRGYGPLRVRQEMRERGLDDRAIGLAMEAVEIDWFETAAQAYHKKFGQVPAQELKEKARRIRFMQYRGFTNEHFQYLVDG